MKISHIALWVTNIEHMRQFYETYLGGIGNKKYENPAKGFTSYFLSFAGTSRLELMHKPGISGVAATDVDRPGIAHLAFSVGSPDAVDALTNRLRNDGYKIIAEPRRTGDGYYESVIADPEGNRLEITA
ncbi:MAG TPA: VOC family protein [bacterium]|nr:VOC family protein [bacterium]HPN44699.1 VOC family protein [bacterium]